MNLRRFLRAPLPYLDLAFYRASRQSIALFGLYMLRIALSGRKARELESHVIDRLDRDGVYVIKHWVIASSARDMQERCAILAVPVLNLPALATTRKTVTGLYGSVPDLRMFADNYMRAACPLAATVYERKTAGKPWLATLEPWHVDGLAKTVKAMLYLTDVTEDTGPFEYMCGSHVLTWQRFKRLYRWQKQRDAKAPSSGWFEDLAHFDEIEELSEFRKLTVLGKAGTLILFDTRGVHRGAPLVSGSRAVLVYGYRGKQF